VGPDVVVGGDDDQGIAAETKARRANREKRKKGELCTGPSDDIQKEKCRLLAKVRRSKESEYFNELEQLLKGSNQNSNTHLDKISLIRLSIAFIQTRNLLNSDIFSCSSLNESFPADILPCLDGFLLVLSSTGVIIYVSNNITQFIGISQVDILGHQFSNYVHPEDHHQLQLFTHHSGDPQDHIEICVRVKSLITERGRLMNLKKANYKSLKISGKSIALREGRAKQYFLCLARVLRLRRDEVAQTGVFRTKHGMDMRFIEYDSWLCDTGGYSGDYLSGVSYYQLVYPTDSQALQGVFSRLFSQGVCETPPYRLLCSGGQVWVQTVAMVINNRGNKGQVVVCRHTQISGVFDRGVALSLTQLDTQKEMTRQKHKIQIVRKCPGKNTYFEPASKEIVAYPTTLQERFLYPTRDENPATKIFGSAIMDSKHMHRKHREVDQVFTTSTLFNISSDSLGLNGDHQVVYALDDFDGNTKCNFLGNFDAFEELDDLVEKDDLVKLSPHSGGDNIDCVAEFSNIIGMLEESVTLGADVETPRYTILETRDNSTHFTKEMFDDKLKHYK